MIGTPTYCVVCGRSVTSCVIPAYCWQCKDEEERDCSKKDRDKGKEKDTMAKNLSPNEYQEGCLRTECDNDKAGTRLGLRSHTRMVHAALGLGKESGEFQDLVTKINFYGKNYTWEEVQEKALSELGDIAYFLALGANAVGLTLQEILDANNRKLAARHGDKYNEQAAQGVGRDKDAESKAMLKGD